MEPYPELCVSVHFDIMKTTDVVWDEEGSNNIEDNREKKIPKEMA